jgi:hypothetical protein
MAFQLLYIAVQPSLSRAGQPPPFPGQYKGLQPVVRRGRCLRYLENCRRPGIEEDRAVIRVLMPNTNEAVFRQAAQAFSPAMGVAAGDE